MCTYFMKHIASVQLLTADDVIFCTIRLPLLALDDEEDELCELQSPDDDVMAVYTDNQNGICLHFM